MAHVSLKFREKIGAIEQLKATMDLPPTAHVFEEESIYALMAALGAGRPLLVRGVPGTGKSQLARAAAHVLDWGFVATVVDAHTEVADLFYSFDAVERLAHAQVIGALHADRALTVDKVRKELDVMGFVRPGPLWWAFEPIKAVEQEEVYRRRGSNGEASERQVLEAVVPTGSEGQVVLIDEIDKADPSVPNGLLEALGQGTFGVCSRETISFHRAKIQPLIVITTNEERELPSAFVRRCVVLELKLPRNDALRGWLTTRGRAHFQSLEEAILDEAVTELLKDRAAARERRLPPPGLAEYIDLLRAVDSIGGGVETLRRLKRFVFEKHFVDDDGFV